MDIILLSIYIFGDNMYVGRGNTFLRGISFRQLKKKYQQEQSDKAKFRLRCAYLRKMGESIPAIASATGRRESTISDILRRFESKGLEAAYAIKQSGQPQKISTLEMSEFKLALLNPPLLQKYPVVIWTTSLVEYYLKEKFGICIGRRHLLRLLQNLGFTLTVTNNNQIEANIHLQKHFTKPIPKSLKKIFNFDRRTPHWVRK